MRGVVVLHGSCGVVGVHHRVVSSSTAGRVVKDV